MITMKQYEFFIEALIVEIDDFNIEHKTIPFTTVASSYEAGRHDALEHAQQIARNYDADGEYKFFYYIGRD